MAVDSVVLDGSTLTPEAVALVARGGSAVVLAAEASARNDAARGALAALLERGEPIYGVSTGVGSLREYRIDEDPRAYSLRLLRSHACSAGRALAVELVRAAMTVRANQLGAGGAGEASGGREPLVAQVNADRTPFTRGLGTHRPGDLPPRPDLRQAHE